jgi:LPS sulfotransferase NodH
MTAMSGIRPAPLQLPPADWQPPARGYAICTLPRSGSNVLCDLLRRSGEAGRPRELLHDQARPAQPQPAAEWMAKLRQAGSTPNGVFAIKLFPSHLAQLEAMHGIRFFDWFPGLTLVSLQRRDLLAQAVSLSVARQTGRWVNADPTRQEPRYDLALTARMLDRLAEWESFWRRRFAIDGKEPLVLFYEDFAELPLSGANRVLEWLGLPQLPQDTVGSTWLGSQSGELNRTWMERFREDMRHRSYRLTDRARLARPAWRWLGDWLTGRLTQPSFRLLRRR